MIRKRRRSVQDHFQISARSEFIGRIEEMHEYRDSLRAPAGDGRHRFIFNIYGDAGVGKTAMLERLQEIAVDSGYLAVFVAGPTDDVASALTATAEQFRLNGAPLGEFEKRAAAYQKLRHKIESDSKAPEGIASFLTKGLVQVGFSAIRGAPVIGALPQVDPAAAGDQADRARAYVVHKLKDRRERDLLLYPDGELMRAFVAGLNRIGKTRPIGLFIDSYERSAHIIDTWLLALYSKRYALPETLVTTVAGQKHLDQNMWHEYRSHISDIPLYPFSRAEAREFLVAKNIANEGMVDVILELSGCLPMWLAMLAAGRPTDPAEIGDPAGDVVERFLQWEEDPERKSAALAGALPRLLNQDLLAAVTPPDRARVMFDWLRRMPFVSTRAKSWAYHEVVRAAMLRLQRAQAPRQWQSDHEALARANERWAQEAAGQSSPAWDNPRWADYFREAMYHLLCADPDNNLDRVLASAEEAAAHSGARARQWAELLADAARDADAPGLNRYAQYLSDSIRSSELVLYSPDEPDDAWAGAREGTLPPTWGETGTDEGTFQAMDPAKERREAKIAVWGPPQSGKTTLLAALSIALNRKATGWNILGADPASEQALIDLTACLSSKRAFPLQTAGIDQFRWILNGWVPGARKLLSRTKRYRAPVRLRLELTEAAGSLLHYDNLGSSPRQDFIGTLMQSQGIIYVFDPIREREHGDAFEATFGPLVQLADQVTTSIRLPHYVAVCITKFDEMQVYRTAEELNLITEDPADPHGFPYVDDKDAREFFWRLCDISMSEDAKMAFNALEQYFWPERIRYFVTSAIGFYIEPRRGRFNREDYQNYLMDEQGGRIRGSVNPINVAGPLLWLGDRASAL